MIFFLLLSLFALLRNHLLILFLYFIYSFMYFYIYIFFNHFNFGKGISGNIVLAHGAGNADCNYFSIIWRKRRIKKVLSTLLRVLSITLCIIIIIIILLLLKIRLLHYFHLSLSKYSSFILSMPTGSVFSLRETYRTWWVLIVLCRLFQLATPRCWCRKIRLNPSFSICIWMVSKRVVKYVTGWLCALSVTVDAIVTS